MMNLDALLATTFSLLKKSSLNFAEVNMMNDKHEKKVWVESHYRHCVGIPMKEPRLVSSHSL